MNFGKIDSFMIFGGGPLTPEFAKEIEKEGFSVIVITSPRNIEDENTLLPKLKEYNLRYVISENVNDDEKVLSEISESMIGISYGAPWILKEAFIQKFKGRLLNIHGTRLPQDRGGATLSWLILQNRRLGFCLIHKLESAIDTGQIVKYKEFFYPSNCRIPREYRQLYEKQNESFLQEFISEVKEQKEFTEIVQLEYLSTYWPRISTEYNGFIDWKWNLRQIELFICAFDEPYKGASTFLNGKRVFLKDCLIDYNDGNFHPYQKGMIYRKTNDSISIATEEGTLIIQNIKDENGKNILNDVKLGERFVTPTKNLENAQQFRAVFTSIGLKNNRNEHHII